MRLARRPAAWMLAGTMPVCLWCQAPAFAATRTTATTAAATAAAPSVSDPVFPGLGNPGYDVASYDLGFSYAEETRTVQASATITAKATAVMQTVAFDSVGARISSVKLDGTSVSFAQQGEKLVLTPPSALRSGKTFQVRVDYTADPRMTVPHSGWVYTDDGFAVGGQPDMAHSVFPCNDVPSDKASFVVQVEVPEGLTGVANGLLASTRTVDGRTRSTYRQSSPMATELLQVVVGEYTVVKRKGTRGQELRDVVPTARKDALEPALALTPGQLDWLEKKLGPLPLDTYGIVPINSDDPPNFDFTGLETQTLTLYRSTYLVQPEKSIGSHMMHELVHSWFGNSVTPRTWSDLWINEGHADFYGLLYRYERGWADSRGYTTMDDRMRYTYSQGDLWRASSGPVAQPNAANLWDSQRYTGGALALYALRERTGAAKFDLIDKTFLAKFRDRSAGTEDFLGVVAQVAGQDTAQFLREWVNGSKTPAMPNHPDWTVDPVPAASSGPARRLTKTPQAPAAPAPHRSEGSGTF